MTNKFVHVLLGDGQQRTQDNAVGSGSLITLENVSFNYYPTSSQAMTSSSSDDEQATNTSASVFPGELDDAHTSSTTVAFQIPISSNIICTSTSQNSTNYNILNEEQHQVPSLGTVVQNSCVAAVRDKPKDEYLKKLKKNEAVKKCRKKQKEAAFDKDKKLRDTEDENRSLKDQVRTLTNKLDKVTTRCDVLQQNYDTATDLLRRRNEEIQTKDEIIRLRTEDIEKRDQQIAKLQNDLESSRRSWDDIFRNDGDPEVDTSYFEDDDNSTA